MIVRRVGYRQELVRGGEGAVGAVGRRVVVGEVASKAAVDVRSHVLTACLS